MKKTLDKGTVRVGVAVAIPGILESLGADPAAVFADAGIDIELFNDPENVIPYAARGHLLKVCVTRTGCEHFGLLLGQQGSLSSFGLIGYLALQSSDVGSALRSLQRYFHLHVKGAGIGLMVEGSLARLNYYIYEFPVESTHQIEDGAMAWSLNILRELCGGEFSPTEVCLAHQAPRDLRPYRKGFRAPISFNSERAGLYFPSEVLRKPLRGVDPKLHRILQKEVDRLHALIREDFLAHLELVLHNVLSVRPATANEVAALFSMSSRTLNRRLNALGTTFSEVADRVKGQIACQMLTDSEMQLTDLADMLHYHDSSSFIKAFKRWTGITPAQWRPRVR